MRPFSPPRTPQADAGIHSLLSLSIAAASAQPIPIDPDAPAPAPAPASYTGPASLRGGGGTPAGKPHSALKHRRMSSSSQARRRLSDAREAASRPSCVPLTALLAVTDPDDACARPVTIQTAAAALNSLAQLSLSGSPPPQAAAPSLTAVSFTSAAGVIHGAAPGPACSAHAHPHAPAPAKVEARDEELDLADAFPGAPPPAQQQPKTEINGAGISVSSRSGNGKKRSTIFKCESCSKVGAPPLVPGLQRNLTGGMPTMRWALTSKLCDCNHA